MIKNSSIIYFNHVMCSNVVSMNVLKFVISDLNKMKNDKTFNFQNVMI